MAEIVNLRLVRKRAARQEAAAAADRNRVAHGVPKADRQRAEAERKADNRRLDDRRLDPGDRQ